MNMSDKFNFSRKICKHITKWDYGTDFWSTFGRNYLRVHAYDAPIIITFGVICNILLLIVLTRKNMLNPTNVFLIGISIADMVTLLTYSCLLLPNILFSKFDFEHSYWYTTFYTPFSMFRWISTWITVMLGTWRVISIYYPFQTFIGMDMKNSKVISIAIYILSIFPHVINLYSIKISHVTCRAKASNATWNLTNVS